VVNDWKVILSEGESYTVEFKESPDKELPAEVCAFANASGGKIYIGIHDKGYIVGTDTSNTARSRIQDTITKIEPNLNVSIDVIDNVVVLSVPEGMYKPYSCPKGFYLRSGPNSQKLDRNSIIEFFQSEGSVRYDTIIRDNLPINEQFNEIAYKRYIDIAKITETIDRTAILMNLNCAGMARGKPCFTNAGALFFRINNEDVMFRHAGIVCALYKGTDKTTILDAKELNGDICSNIEDAILFLKKHLRISYKIETLKRENILELPEDALREAIVNAACHRNYFEIGSRVMVEVFDDRVDVVSPGGVCKGITHENFGTVTITRNPIVASMFFRIDYIEQMGTGISRMRDATRKANVAEPIFQFDGCFKVTFKRNTVDTANSSSGSQEETKRQPSGSQEEAKRQPSGNQAAAKRKPSGSQAEAKRKPSGSQAAAKRQPSGSQAVVTAADRRHEIITVIQMNGQVSSSELVKILGLTARRIRMLLREMVNDGAIEKIGDNRYARYILKQ
jgi:ATP-dependent DNA helicase RecG